jgi:hypothetical protein
MQKWNYMVDVVNFEDIAVMQADWKTANDNNDFENSIILETLFDRIDQGFVKIRVTENGNTEVRTVNG